MTIDIAIQALFHECGWENFTINDVDFKQAAISGFIGAAGAGVSGIVSSLTSSTTSLFTRTGLRIVGNGLGSALVTGTAKYYEMLNNGIWGGSDIGDDWSEVAYSSAISGLLGMFGSAIGEGIVIVNGGVKALPEILANRYGGISPRFENLISPTIVSMADSFSWFISSGSSGLFVEETSQCSCE